MVEGRQQAGRSPGPRGGRSGHRSPSPAVRPSGATRPTRRDLLPPWPTRRAQLVVGLHRGEHGVCAIGLGWRSGPRRARTRAEAPGLDRRAPASTGAGENREPFADGPVFAAARRGQKRPAPRRVEHDQRRHPSSHGDETATQRLPPPGYAGPTSRPAPATRPAGAVIGPPASHRSGRWRGLGTVDRRAGSFSRHFRTIVSRSRSSPGRIDDGRGGSASRT